MTLFSICNENLLTASIILRYKAILTVSKSTYVRSSTTLVSRACTSRAFVRLPWRAKNACRLLSFSIRLIGDTNVRYVVRNASWYEKPENIRNGRYKMSHTRKIILKYVIFKIPNKKTQSQSIMKPVQSTL